MNSLNIYIDNLKCHGCANTIKKSIKEIAGVQNIDILVEENLVTVEGENLDKATISQKLSSLGYPEQGEKNSLQHKVKSYVSCAIGRVSK